MQYTENVLYIDLLSPDFFRHYPARPERLNELIDGNPDKNIVTIDEIQKVPLLLDVVHQVIESDKNMRFILTGSSSRKLKRTGIDLLAGRAAYKKLHPFMALEMGVDFDFEHALRYGMLPLFYGSSNPAETLNAYFSKFKA